MLTGCLEPPMINCSRWLTRQHTPPEFLPPISFRMVLCSPEITDSPSAPIWPTQLGPVWRPIMSADSPSPMFQDLCLSPVVETPGPPQHPLAPIATALQTDLSPRVRHFHWEAGRSGSPQDSSTLIPTLISWRHCGVLVRWLFLLETGMEHSP